MKRFVFDVAALIARVTLGVILVAHGWQKWQNGLGGTTQMFTETGIPLPELAAAFTTAAELVGGVLLIIGLLVRLAAAAWFVVGAGAIVFVHGGSGIFVREGGWEFVASLMALCLLFVALGGGRIGVDGLIHGAWRRRRAERRLAKEGAATGGPVAGSAAAGAQAGGTPATGAPTGAPPAGGPAHGPPVAPPGSVPRQAPAPGDMAREDTQGMDSLFGDESARRKPPNR